MIKNKKRDKEFEKPIWVEIQGLYDIYITLSEFLGYKNVKMQIIRWNTDDVPFDPEKYVPDFIPKNSAGWEYANILDCLKESFLIDEIRQIKRYLRRFPGTTIHKPSLCGIPKNYPIAPLGRMPAGGGVDYHLFFKSPDYPLSFDIAGYYNLKINRPINKKEVKK